MYTDSNPAQLSNVKQTGIYFKSRSGYRFSEINIFRWQEDTRFAKIALSTVPYVYWFQSGPTVNPGSTFNYIAEWCWNLEARANTVQRQIKKKKKLGFWYCVLFRNEKRKNEQFKILKILEKEKSGTEHTFSNMIFDVTVRLCGKKQSIGIGSVIIAN